MKATIRPLRGKYYGTIVDLPDVAGSIKLWFASGTPSRRELEQLGYTQEQWDRNEPVNDGWDSPTPIRQIVMCDSHYECNKTLKIAEAIVKALEGVEL